MVSHKPGMISYGSYYLLLTSDIKVEADVCIGKLEVTVPRDVTQQYGAIVRGDVSTRVRLCIPTAFIGTKLLACAEA
jgi:hypothetical protein